MTPFDVYLESVANGPCMAHVPALPGCFATGDSESAAVAAVVDAVRDYYGWLQQHGESAAAPEPIAVQVAATTTGFGPFHPGDKAALFTADRETLPRETMENVYFCRADYARADLLALTRHLPARILDWQADPDAVTIRQILRHVGNAEEWYASRVVDPATLPPEWAGDAQMAIFDFLAMERRTMKERLRQLTADERNAVLYPAQWTEHPDEAWTLRKALRRTVEHEVEHTGQIRQILATWRGQLLARLAAERSELPQPLLSLDEAALTQRPV
jgi:predicted RNase H-like HicB family nuclease/uncharacterized damage-inducible protein DinB